MLVSAVAALLLLQLPSDVPSAHWASAAVGEVVSRGVMKAPGGKFAGSSNVTRRELTLTLAEFAKSLESSAWPTNGSAPVKQAYRDRKATATGVVTRYELAAVLYRVSRYMGHGLPKPGPKPFGNSDAFPPKPKILLPKSDPAYASAEYLVSRRMAFSDSVVVKPGLQHVTPKELAIALTWVVTGLTDRRTDEPQNREELGPPPTHRHNPAPRQLRSIRG